ncbi:hypothetical protein O6H91_02G102700 [Diphasiastrum complanatum]|uniref:Uncharacterized protein n=1 Tax=Diphasiastrum complanatum TaxID=34168 RepID=A0ACC2EIV9_DIPCM|nr:hypothetical protein O6H91_02G102700 [Diphasiastrum complanatum]
MIMIVSFIQRKQKMVRKGSPDAPRLTCLCAPTTHVGSFRCRLHRASEIYWKNPHKAALQQPPADCKEEDNPAPVYHGNDISSIMKAVDDSESKAKISYTKTPLSGKHVKPPSRLGTMVSSAEVSKDSASKEDTESIL